jgi:4-hydroxy-tetrahydrodipicolinate synthase
MTFQGLLTALVTPFKDGAVDEQTFRTLVRRQIAGGAQGLVPCGTTGEAPTLSVDEQASIVGWTIEEAAGDVPVMAGIGSNCTATAVANAKRAEAMGVQGVLATAPYYNKPTQEGLYLHFKAIAEAVGVEVCLYDVPGRSVVHISPRTVARLAEIENITALKDATGDMANAIDVRRRCGDSLALLSGDDFTTLPFLAQGGVGVISVAANVVPEKMRALVDLARQGDTENAAALSETLFPLFRDLFLESNPIPVKAALAHLGLLTDGLRLPLTPMSNGVRPGLFETVDRVLAD